jgi:SNF2 family DNA or RNA helicase
LYEKLWDFQKSAAEFILGSPSTALFAEQGTGKTWITVGVIERLVKEGGLFTALIVVPLTNLRTTWVKTLNELQSIVVCYTWDEFRAALGPKVLLIHYEAMAKYDRQITKHFLWDLVVFDESQKIKARGSRQSRIAGRIRNARRRLILTGTPFDDLTENPQELWAQFRFVAPDLFGTRWKDFDDHYLIPTGYMGYKRRFRTGALDEILKKIKPYCLRVTKREVLDLPPITYRWVKAPMLGEQRRLYETFEKDMVATVNGQEVSAELEITKLVRLQQICSGFVKDDDDTIHKVGRAKLRRLLSMIKRTEFPIVVFCKYLEEVSQIEQELAGICNVATIIGRTRKTRDATLEAFQQGKIDVLIAQVRTGGVGVDLFRSHTVLFYSTTFSFIDFEQAVARVHRAGQKSAVNIYLIYAEKTIDKLIYEALLCKRSVSDFVLRKLKRQKGDPNMAKKTKSRAVESTSAVEPKADKAPKTDAPKYGIAELAEALGVGPASARVKLRSAKIAKVGGRYGWNTKAEMNEVVDKIKSKEKAE